MGKFHRWTLAVPLALASLVAGPLGAAAEGRSGPVVDPKAYQALEYRCIGPYRGGRVTAVTGVVGERDTFYMGSTGGGVWKTTDGGETWRNLTDGQFGSASVGAVAVAPSDPNVVYAGTGSACIRGNVSPGDGIYRSTDAGESWKRVGLDDAGQIGRIRIDPRDPDRVYAAVLGHAFGPSEQRGVFRSTDGGESWDRVLYVGEDAGAVDLAMDPTNPRILYAAIWQVVRKPWALISGGESSGLYRSADGGESWDEVTEGLPQGIKGRIGVAVSAADPARVWALVEAEEGGLFRSDDGAERFRRINDDRSYRQRAWYYTHVFADPADENTVYVLNVGMWRSDDGGKSFEFIRTPHGDHHDLWISPDDPKVLINGSDGGASVSRNGGESWSSQANQPTAEIYRVTVDDRFPYRVYGSQQDNTTISIPSRTSSSGILHRHAYPVGGCESGRIAVDPRDPEIVYAGCYGGIITRYDHRTGQARSIMTYPELALGQAPRDLRYRFQWSAPIRLSPHDPGLLYHTSQIVHRSTDEGRSWELISPDLTRDDSTKQDYSGGPITRDNTGVEVYGTIFSFEPSPLVAGTLWAGSDDGRVHISRDDGRTWREITPENMPEWGRVNTIELSPHAAGRAFLAVTRYRLDDFRPYVFRTDDFGANWKLLTDGRNGVPKNHFVRVVREDPRRKGLLYAGTEFGVYVSFDDGKHWQPLQLNLPVTPVTDLAVKDGDLVVATQGRSFWILDDLTPLRVLGEEAAVSEPLLFPVRPTHRFPGGGGFGGGKKAGKNPPNGAIVHYALPAGAEEEVILEILDADGNLLRRLSSESDEPSAPDPYEQYLPPDAKPKRRLDAEEGMNRYVWDLRLHDAELLEGTVLWGRAAGPRVPPGSYRARLSVGDWSGSTAIEVLKDPRVAATPEEFESQFELARRTWKALSQVHRTVKRVRSVRLQVRELVRRLDEAGRGEGLEPLSAALLEKLDSVEDRLVQARAVAAQDVLNFPPRLDAQFLALLSEVESADAAPTDGELSRYGDLRAELDRHLADLDRIFADELTAFNERVDGMDLPPVIVPAGDSIE